MRNPEGFVDLDLDQLEALARAATPGPWNWATDWGRAAVYSTSHQVPRYKRDPIYKRVVCSGHQNNEGRFEKEDWSGADWRDAEYIAAANPAIILQLIELARTNLAAPDAPQASAAQEVRAVPGRALDNLGGAIKMAVNMLSRDGTPARIEAAGALIAAFGEVAEQAVDSTSTAPAAMDEKGGA